MVLNKMNKWVNEDTKCLQSESGKFMEAAAFDQNLERVLEFQKWN